MQPAPIRSWGGLTAPGTQVASEEHATAARSCRLSRGLGRSYGDATLPVPGDRCASCVLADRLLSFDPRDGVLRAEPGLSVLEINRLFWPRGWTIPVTPGTQYVTLGGMVAADVHGKNHHVEGSFAEHVAELLLLTGPGEIVACSPTERPDLFDATLGGMGLTGHVLEVVLRMQPIPSAWILAESVRVPGLQELLRVLRESSTAWPFTAAWVDCATGGGKLGRGVVHRGRWAAAEAAPADPPRPRRTRRVPLTAPDWLLNRLTLRLFNAAYYRAHPPRPRPAIVHPESFFYPLDSLRDWHRLYGSRGFTQYQFVVPREAHDATAGLLQRFVERGGVSFLSVIKDFGPQGRGLLSFPREGTTVALDLPMGPGTQATVDALNELVIAHGGRIYLAKDALTRREHFAAMEPRLEHWRAVRRRWDPQGRLRSALGERLLADAPPTASASGTDEQMPAHETGAH